MLFNVEVHTHQDNELMAGGAVEDTVCSNSFPEVFVYGVVCTAVKREDTG